jgi:hypothetical protein
MPLPVVHIDISASVVAAYAAVVSTITGAVQVINHFKDRASLLIQVQLNMEMVGDPRYKGMTLTRIGISNNGRRPVTITNVGAYRLHPHKPFIVVDTRPALPCELTEGKQMTALMDQSDLDLAVMESWEVYTATGKTFRVAVIPWYRRWWNRRRIIRHAIAEGKKKQLAEQS